MAVDEGSGGDLGHKLQKTQRYNKINTEEADINDGSDIENIYVGKCI